MTTARASSTPILRRTARRSPTFAAVIGLVAGVVLMGMVVPYVRVQTVSVERATTGVPGVLGTPTGGAGSLAATAAGPATGSTTGSAAAAGSGSGSGVSASSPAAGVGSSAGPTGGQSVGAQGGAEATASAVGVTASEIKLGIGIINVGAAKAFGFNFDIGNEQGRFQALIDSVNAAGGVNGRKIVPYYYTFDATNPDVPGQAACLAWTKDDRVFSVLVESQFPTAAEVCIFGQGDTPFITTQGTDQSYYANGLFFTTQASDNRTLADEANFLAGNGSLVGQTVGVVSGDGSDELAVDDTLVPALASMGHQVKDVEVIPSTTAGTQQISIAISNLKAAGVTFVIIAANVILAGPFVQAANHAGYNPKYALSDFNNEINDQVANYYPSSFEGTVGLSTHRFAEYRDGAPFAPADQACLNVVHPVDSTVLPTTNSAFEVAMGDCAIFDAWLAGVRRAGPALTQASFLTAMGQSGTFGIPGTQNGSFGPGKHDAEDNEQEVAWQESCTCWELVDGLSTPVRMLQS
jgi:hypothetical protein